jgi:FkbM family methyltransferase
MKRLKSILRKFLIFIHLDLTKNLKYDRLTLRIFKKYVKSHFNCIDIGSHKGEILDLMLKYANNGTHYAFEPIPSLFDELTTKYKEKATIFPYALADSSGKTTFQFVKNAPAYSGLQRRRYDIANPDILEIEVEKRTLDEIISHNNPIHFIKIDVEGGEFGVLKGGRNILEINKPMILFECGKGASDYYGIAPSDIFLYLTENIGLEIYTLSSFIKKKKALTQQEFINYFNTNREYYFIAGPAFFTF